MPLHLNINDPKLGDFSGIFHEIPRILEHIARKRKIQLLLLLVLQIVGAFSEVLSLGAFVPFLAVIANASEFMENPQVIILTDFFHIYDEGSLTVILSVGFVLAFVIVNILRLLTLFVQSKLGAAIGSDLSTDFFYRALNQNFEFHLNVNSGKLISTTLNDLGATLGFIFSVMMIVTQGLAIIAIMSALFVYDSFVASIIIGITAFSYFLVMKFNKNQLVKNGRIISDNRAIAIRMLQEGFGGIRDVLLGRKQKNFLTRYTIADRAFRQASAKNRIMSVAPRYILEVFGVGLLTLTAA